MWENLLTKFHLYYIVNKKKEGEILLQYKINIIKELNRIGINTTTAKKSGIFAQDTMRKFKDGDTNISLEVLNRLCCILEMQPRDIIKFVETDEDREKIISKICDIKAIK